MSASQVHDDTEHATSSVPGDLLLHPLGLMALGLWIANDHLFKAWWGNAATGKLSDIACLVAFPLLLVALYEVAVAVCGGRWQRSKRALAVAVTVTGFVMVSINVWPAAAWTYTRGLGIAQWPFRAAHAWWIDAAFPAPGLVDLTMDASDLWTLPALCVAVWIHRRTRG